MQKGLMKKIRNYKIMQHSGTKSYVILEYLSK